MDVHADDAPPLVAAPRHLKRRTFHEDIPDELLVPGAPSISIERDRRSSRNEATQSSESPDARYRRKRQVALLLVVLVLLSIPALIVALVFAG